MSNFDEIRKAQIRMQAKMTKVFKGAAISLFNNIIVQSPVDTGRFRANWQATINSPYEGTIGTAGVHYGSVDKVDSKIGTAKLSDRLYLTNNLPYARALEDGHSKQAPQKWVATSVMMAKEKLKGVL